MNQDMYWFLIEAKYRYQKLDAISLTKMNQYRNIHTNILKYLSKSFIIYVVYLYFMF